MIYCFTLQVPECFSDARSNGPELASHRRLIGEWRSYLTFYAGDKAALTKLITAMPKRFQELWIEAIKNNYPIRYSDGLDLALAMRSNYVAFLSTAGISIFIIHPEHKRKYGLRASDVEKIVKGITVTPINCFDQSNHLIFIRRLYENDISAGENTDGVFDQRIHPIIDCARFVSIVDRYIIKSTMISIERKRMSGMERMLRGLSTQRTLKKVSLYLSKLESEVTEEMRERFVEKIREMRNKYWRSDAPELNIFASDDSDFARNSHDRYIRADTRVIKLGSGLDVLNGPNVWRSCQSSLGSNGRQKLGDEKVLADCSKKYVI
jgi:hypothetical protein